MQPNELLNQITKVVRKEMFQWRGTSTYAEIEVFVGCVLVELKAQQILTTWEESVIRQRLLG